MSAHLLLNLLNKLKKAIKCKACQFLLLLCKELNQFNIEYRSTNVRFYLSYDFRITLKSLFWYETFRFWHYVWNIIVDFYYYVNHK